MAKPDQPITLTQLATTCLNLGDVISADAALDKALRLDGNCIEALRMSADFLGQTGRHDEAVETCRRLLHRSPRDVTGLLVLGRSLVAIGDFAEAEAAYAKVLVVDPKNEVARENLTVVQTKRGGLFAGVTAERLVEGNGHSSQKVEETPKPHRQPFDLNLINVG